MIAPETSLPDPYAPVQMRQVSNYNEVEFPGDFYWSQKQLPTDNPGKPGGKQQYRQRFIHIAIPTGSLDVITREPAFQMVKIGVGGKSPFKWNKKLDLPTITPSLDITDIWHGHVVDGFLKKLGGKE